MQNTTNADILSYTATFCNMDKLDASVNLPQMGAYGEEFYPTLSDKAVILTFALVNNHCFYDGNKRTAHLALETFLLYNAWTIRADGYEQEAILYQIATNQLTKEAFTVWLKNHIEPFDITIVLP